MMLRDSRAPAHGAVPASVAPVAQQAARPPESYSISARL